MMFSKFKVADFRSSKQNDWTDPVPDFGQDIKLQEFFISTKLTQVNQAAFGIVPKRVLERAEQIRRQTEADSELAVRRQYPVEWDRVAALAAEFVGADVGNVVFCHNTTTGISNILTSYPFQKGDGILYNNYTFYVIKNQIHNIIDNRRPGVTSLEMTYPDTINSKEEIIQQYEAMLADNPNIKLALIDHISCRPAILFPVKELVQVCHSHGVDVLIDGAHCPGQLQLNLEDIGADFYVGNMHKWAYAIRACAIQYVVPRYHDVILSSVVSETGDYSDRFKGPGTTDLTKYFTVETALQFYNWIGGHPAIAGHAAHVFEYLPELVAAWGTTIFPIPSDMECPMMRNVKVPDMPAYEKSQDGAGRLSDDLYDLYGIWTKVGFLQGELWVRISASVFNDQSDLITFKDAILELQAQAPDSEPQQLSKAKYEERKKVFGRVQLLP